MVNKILDIGSMLVVVAGIMVLVRPGSKGPDLVTAIMQGFQGSLASATGATPAGFTAAPGG